MWLATDHAGLTLVFCPLKFDPRPSFQEMPKLKVTARATTTQAWPLALWSLTGTDSESETFSLQASTIL